MEKKQRVPKDEPYYWIMSSSKYGFLSVYHEEMNLVSDNDRWESGNYFNSRKDADVIAKKLNAVLKGAEVIEMPSDEEIQKVLAEKIPIHGGRTYGEALNCCWFEEGIHWLRDNKIVK